MGKSGGTSSWLTAFERVFRINKIKEESDHKDEQKNRGKQETVFGRTSNHESVIHCEAKTVSVDKEVVRLNDHLAAIIIQKTFKGYLARKALMALKGVVKLQALIRGYIVRNRAKLTLQCMQSLIRVQTRVRDHQRRLSHEGNRNSTLFGSKFYRNSISGDGSGVAEKWDEYSNQTVKETKEILMETKESALKREKALAYAFSKSRLLGCRTTRLPLENRSRASFDQKNSIQFPEMNSSPPYSRISHKLKHPNAQNQTLSSHSVSSPKTRAYQNISIHSPITPPPLKSKHLQVHSSSPRCKREENQAVQTPSYMAATASAMARSQSTPKQRISTSDREKLGSVKKRLSFPVPELQEDFHMSCYYN